LLARNDIGNKDVGNIRASMAGAWLPSIGGVMSATLPVARTHASDRTTARARAVAVWRSPGPEDGVDHEAGTRQRVLQIVTADGPVSATELAAELDLTTAAIRRHLAVLEGNGQITVHQAHGAAPARRGRPARRYVVTSQGQAAQPHAYSGIAAEALRYLAEVAGPEAVEAFAERRVKQLEDRHGAVVEAAGDDPVARVQALADALAADGYAATARPVPGAAAVQLCQGHCPVQQVAQEFPQICEAEAQAFSRMLGVHVQRLATLAGGGHVCTTNIPTMTTPAPAEGR